MALVPIKAYEQWKQGWGDLIRNNDMTEARQSLRATSDNVLKINPTLKQQLDDRRGYPENGTLMSLAIEKCEDETVKKWLQQNSGSADFSKLEAMFNFLKKHISEEEKKDHDDKIDIIFMAHGNISNSMIPACCLLPLSTIMDVVLYSPWNCILSAEAAYGIAAGVMKPQHRVFEYRKVGCPTPKKKHCPGKLPNHWNSMKISGKEDIPHISLSPLNPPKDGYLKRFESLAKEYGLPVRNRIVIKYIIPAGEETSQQGEHRVPFYVVSLAFSLALLSSRFRATIHLPTCLGDQSAGRKCDKKYLKHQYACAVDDTMMTASPDMFKK